MTKIIAFYLPQYHEIKENNEWWGEGFTEWTNVKNAKALYRDHYQPKKPYKDNYYCLLENETQKWQSDLARKYGIYGFCYYHYWFNGKMLLEKPMENMLNNPDINIKFCISWANEPWTKTWTGKDKEVLMPQKYGGIEEWEEHIKYLIPFFKDSRYILKDNKPVFLLYRAENIVNCGEMIEYWERRLKEQGFSGIYVIETLTGWQKKEKIDNSSAVVPMEPMHCFARDLSLLERIWHSLIKKLKLQRFHIYNFYSYDIIWEKIIKKNIETKKDVYYGAFMNWDNTARKGENAIVIKGFSLEKFKKYFDLIYKRSLVENKDFLFFNAWNEWSEGTYLEPDDKYQFEYLKIISEVKKNKQI
ncbi:MAG: glycoside hydrolase family 99-like domain-containing protein [Clostridia bacterium]|nr:glycoside hydrolase family 99-like domain-containing protein [Clostridia bacterium]